jgi:hypothetical protein
MFRKKLSSLDVGEVTVSMCQNYYEKVVNGCPPEDDLFGRARYLLNARNQATGMEFFAQKLDSEFGENSTLALPVTSLVVNLEKMIEFNFSKMSDEQLDAFENSPA